jgi:hypothetical protein
MIIASRAAIIHTISTAHAADWFKVRVSTQAGLYGERRKTVTREDEDGDARVLLARLRSFLLPGGEDSARRVRCVRLKEQGEIRSAPDAHWIPFTAEERIDAHRSGFVWEARLRTARIVPMVVVDAYEGGQGRLVVKIGGAVPVVNVRGPDADKGELQRYLAGAASCPPMVVAHPTLAWASADAQTLRLRDSEDPTGATVDIEIGEDGLPVITRAERPRMVGKNTVLTPWSATALDFREQDGFRLATRREAAWHIPQGAFTYFRSEVLSYELESA